MFYPFKRLLCGVFCVASVGLASAAGNNPIPDLTDTDVTPVAATVLVSNAPVGSRLDPAGQPLLSFLSNDDDSDFIPVAPVETPLSPASPRHVAALLLAGITLVAYRTRNQRLPLRTAR